jgi:antirestriction protein ArdC
MRRKRDRRTEIRQALQVLKGDNRAIFQAASMASKAADFVMGRREAGRVQNGAAEIRLESAA